jgi:hypothetical protein
LDPVFLKIAIELTLFPEEGFSKAIAQLYAIDPFIIVHLDASIAHHNVFLLEKIEERHVNNVRVELLELDSRAAED